MSQVLRKSLLREYSHCFIINCLNEKKIQSEKFTWIKKISQIYIKGNLNDFGAN